MCVLMGVYIVLCEIGSILEFKSSHLGSKFMPEWDLFIHLTTPLSENHLI